MQVSDQEKIAFFLTGRRSGTDLKAIDGSYRPALFAGYADLTTLRYDLPLVLNFDERPDRAVLSLSALIDDAVGSLAADADRDRIARHGYAVEQEIRKILSEKISGDFAELWTAAVERLAQNGDGDVAASASILWKCFDASGTIIDADADLSSRVLFHAWKAVQENKASTFRRKAKRLLLKLHGILDAEFAGSAEGRAPERLRAAVGSSFSAAFDFDEMSRILDGSKPSFALSDQRRNRIKRLIEVLETQRFYPVSTNSAEPYSFSFFRCSDALEAYRERHAEAVELLKTLAIAELESKVEYRESVHDILFDGFGANGLNADELGELPDYFVCTDAASLDAAEIKQLIDLLAAGLPIKAVVRTDDILEPSIVAEGHAALGIRSRQLVNTAIALTDVFVLQTCASNLYKMREPLLRGLSFDGPALFSVFSGSNKHNYDLPPYLVSAAAMESRAFPAFVYDPSAGSNWAGRLSISENPHPFHDWPGHDLLYEDESLQARSEKLAFTFADFIAMDDRYADHFAIGGALSQFDGSVSVTDALDSTGSGIPSEVPTVALVNDQGILTRAVIDERLLCETRRCRSMWHSLQELGGIHNSHAERLLAAELKRMESEIAPKPEVVIPSPESSAPLPAVTVTAEAAEPVREDHGDEPYIETPRCTTCNECTNVNPRMFAYNSEKQAYIADPDAGTFRQLVEAAEGCQVSIIHPGKPRNPKEPGLEDLIARAAPFN